MPSSHRQKRLKEKPAYLFKYLLAANFLEYLEAGAVPALLLHLAKSFHMNSGQLGLLGGIVYLSLSVGGPFAGYMLRHFDHQMVIGCAFVINNIFTLLWALTPVGYHHSTSIFIALRFLMGFSQCAVCVFIPLWTNEFAPKDRKTSWMSYQQASVPFGVMTGYIIASAITTLSHDAETCFYLLCWRWPFIIEVILLIPICVGVFFVPKEHISIRISTKANASRIDSARATPSHSSYSLYRNQRSDGDQIQLTPLTPLNESYSGEHYSTTFTTTTADEHSDITTNRSSTHDFQSPYVELSKRSRYSTDNGLLGSKFRGSLIHEDDDEGVVVIPPSRTPNRDVKGVSADLNEREMNKSFTPISQKFKGGGNVSGGNTGGQKGIPGDVESKLDALTLRYIKDEIEEEFTDSDDGDDFDARDRSQQQNLRRSCINASLVNPLYNRDVIRASNDKLTALGLYDDLIMMVPGAQWNQNRENMNSPGLSSDRSDSSLGSHQHASTGSMNISGPVSDATTHNGDIAVRLSLKPQFVDAVTAEYAPAGVVSPMAAMSSPSHPPVQSLLDATSAEREQTRSLSEDYSPLGHHLTANSEAPTVDPSLASSHSEDYPYAPTTISTTSFTATPVDEFASLSAARSDDASSNTGRGANNGSSSSSVSTAVVPKSARRRSFKAKTAAVPYISLRELAKQTSSAITSNADLVESSRRRKSDHKMRTSLGNSHVLPSVLEAAAADGNGNSKTRISIGTSYHALLDIDDEEEPLRGGSYHHDDIHGDFEPAYVPTSSSADISPESSFHSSEHHASTVSQIIGNKSKGDGEGFYSSDSGSDEEKALSGSVIPSPERSHNSRFDTATVMSTIASVKALLAMPVYRNLLFAMTALYFTVTGVQYWGTSYIAVGLHAPLPLANALFIACAATGPTLGVFFGGWSVDVLGGYKGLRQRVVALELCAVFGIFGCLFSLPITFFTNVYLTVSFLWAVLFFGAAMLPACSGMLVSMVPRKNRPLSSSLSLIVFNLFGYSASLLLSGLLMQVLDNVSDCDAQCSITWGFRLVLVWCGLALFFLVRALMASYNMQEEQQTLALRRSSIFSYVVDSANKRYNVYTSF